MALQLSFLELGDFVRPVAAQGAVELDSIGQQQSLGPEAVALEPGQAGERIEHGEIIRLSLLEQSPRFLEEPPAELDLRPQAAQALGLVVLLKQRILHASDRRLDRELVLPLPPLERQLELRRLGDAPPSVEHRPAQAD